MGAILAAVLICQNVTGTDALRLVQAGALRTGEGGGIARQPCWVALLRANLAAVFICTNQYHRDRVHHRLLRGRSALAYVAVETTGE